jgi:enolase-phosphatase E1
LFPYASEQLTAFVQGQIATMPLNANVQQALEAVKGTILQEGLEPSLPATGCITDANVLTVLLHHLHQWILHDRKHPALKQLQGQLWRTGYQQGAFVGHLYPDVLPWWRHQHAANKRLAIYSSGSVEAQQLLLGYSSEGDVTPLIEAYFDTAVGAKQHTESYHAIAKALKIPTEKCVFFSDKLAELEAAQHADMQAIQLCRTSRNELPLHEQFPVYCHAFY